jgi:hypothetical protein
MIGYYTMKGGVSQRLRGCFDEIFHLKMLFFIDSCPLKQCFCGSADKFALA